MSLTVEDLLDSAESGNEHENDAVDEVKHGRLIDKIKALYGSRDVRQRAEASRNVSEFDFTRDGGLSVMDMLQDLNNTAEMKMKRNKITRLKKKASALPEPLPKVSRERLQRGIAYAKASDDLKKWDTIVEYQKNADDLQFPLEDSAMKIEKGADFVKRFEPSTKLEQDIDQLLASSKHRLDSDMALTEFEEEQLKNLTKEEALSRIAELRRMRSLMHAEAVKNRRLRKIKSRKYHRILRKDKMKQAIREFESLKVTDPKKALERLEELEKIRREERVSLRHKTKNKWASQIARRGAHDKDAQAALRERAELGKELETKAKMDDEADSDADTPDVDKDEENVDEVMSDVEERGELERSMHEEEDDAHEENPWLRRTFFEEVHPKDSKETTQPEATSEDKNVESSEKQAAKKPPSKKKPRNVGAGSDLKDSPRIPGGKQPAASLSKAAKKRKSKSEVPDPTPKKQSTVAGEDSDEDSPVWTKLPVAPEKQKNTDSAICIDPSNILEINPTKKLISPHEKRDNEESDDDQGNFNDDRQRELIREAFAGDDVIDDFIKHQKDKAAKERKTEEDEALKQKGFNGAWVTPNNIHKLDNPDSLKTPCMKSFKARAAIVNEEADLKGIKKLKAIDIPKSFTSVAQFETVLKQPVGSQFNTHRAFNELTKPRVRARIGKVIKPMDQSALMKPIKSDLKKSNRRPVRS